MMTIPFPKSIPDTHRLKRLLEVVDGTDTLGILINADPDSMASAMALKRILWNKVKRALIYRINPIKRADNLAFVKLLTVDQKHIRYLKRRVISKWALVDSQPHHHKLFMDLNYAIIMDHHPVTEPIKADFLDIREDYGANSSILTEYLKSAKIKPSPKLATALFYGIKTDTDNFIRASGPHDMAAFKYLYPFTNMQILKKIESSEMTRSMLPKFRQAIEQLIFIRDIAYVHMDRVDSPDLLVSVADFFLNIAEIEWSIVSGVYKETLVVILRNAGFHGDAGKTANDLFKIWKGSAGGHKNAARAEIPLQNVLDSSNGESGLGAFVKTIIKQIK